MAVFAIIPQEVIKMELWTAAHVKTILPAFAAMLLAAAILRAFLGKKSLKIRMIPFQILSGMIILLEIGKQVISFSRGYDLYHIPLHYCSLFIFMMPAMAFYWGKYRHVITSITPALCASLLALMLIYPNLIYSAGNVEEFFTEYMSFHTVSFHNIVMFAFVLIVALDLHTPRTHGEQKSLAIFMTGYCAIASVMAQILKTNYANFYQCNIPVFEELRLSLQGVLGVAVTQILYVLIVAALTVVFTLGFYWVYRLLQKPLSTRKTVEA